MVKKEYPPTADALMEILKVLRSPEGCPWDKAQTAESFGECFAGEAGELLDAIDRKDAEGLKDECGDVLMNVFFQILLAEERGEFTLSDVWANINAKMVRRHAHIFGDRKADSPEEVVKLWQEIKAQEKAAKPRQQFASILDEVKPMLSALTRAEKLQKKAAKTGFDWGNAKEVLAKVKEECSEVEEAMDSGDESHTDEEIGDLLFSVVNLIRFRHRSSSEELLRRASLKFTDRFRYVEQGLARQGRSLGEASLEEMETLWQQAKKETQDRSAGRK